MIPSFDEYQELALRTASQESLVDQSTMLNAAALGLNGEAGEIADHVKKIMFHGHPLDDATMTGPRLRQTLATDLAALGPFVDYLCASLDLEF